MVNTDAIRRRFSACFDGEHPTVLARAPGRVNLIGEHTDYNDGLCMPAAIAQHVCVAARPRDDNLLRAFSVALETRAEVRLDADPVASGVEWMAYVAGLARSLRDAGYRPPGADLLIQSDLPIGVGLASSAALITACAKALLALQGGLLETAELVSICVDAECRHAGTPCGVMDPAAALMSKQDSVMLLDCRSLAVEYIMLGETETRLVLIDSGVAHENRAGKYAQRRAECQAGVSYFQQFDARIKSLRDVSQPLLARHMTQLDPTVAARCHHVVAENARVREAAAALRRRDMAELGKLLNASHASLRDWFSVSCPETDRIVDVACATTGVLGARMMGGGFGGCVLVLCAEDGLSRLKDALHSANVADLSRPNAIIEVQTADGADWQAL